MSGALKERLASLPPPTLSKVIDVKVLLVQVDGKLPNLALMKLSSWHKARGDIAGFNVADPDRIYVSIVFKRNKENSLGIPRLYSDAEVFYGGPGHDLDTELPKEIEFSVPDYSLYPKMDFSMGFTTRGCIRNCYFCIVPEKEGLLTRWQHPKEFHNPAFKKVMLLDNNWLADKEWFMETSQWIIDNKLSLREGGMDIRLLDDDMADQLSKIDFYKPMHFAFDQDADKDDVLKGIQMLSKHNINLRQKVQFFVYIDGPEQVQSGLARCQQLKKWGTNPFVMYNMDRPRNNEIRHLQRWANRKWLFWKIDFSEYGKKSPHHQRFEIREVDANVH